MFLFCFLPGKVGFLKDPPKNVQSSYYKYYDVSVHIYAIVWASLFIFSGLVFLIGGLVKHILLADLMGTINMVAGLLLLMGCWKKRWLLYLPSVVLTFGYLVYFTLAAFINIFFAIIYASTGASETNKWMEKLPIFSFKFAQVVMPFNFILDAVIDIFIVQLFFTMFFIMLRAVQYAVAYSKTGDFDDKPREMI